MLELIASLVMFVGFVVGLSALIVFLLRGSHLGKRLTPPSSRKP